ncbi:hypothetical protein FF38_10503 [Lucilia cuprina]|uniref:Uncharacterized protein n=1 Tax=Lucilia cuprina TaxID=7375 RepID=A0A0L0CDL0_LUCCU|nr:hypothetical protein FF38_10503 [Lucilia cuprina]
MRDNVFYVVCLCVGVLVACVISTAILASAIKQELNDMRVQGQCISEKINAGVERRDIKLIGSTDCEEPRMNGNLLNIIRIIPTHVSDLVFADNTLCHRLIQKVDTVSSRRLVLLCTSGTSNNSQIIVCCNCPLGTSIKGTYLGKDERHLGIETMKGNLVNIVTCVINTNPSGPENRYCKKMRIYTEDTLYGDPLCNVPTYTKYPEYIIECHYCPLAVLPFKCYQCKDWNMGNNLIEILRQLTDKPIMEETGKSTMCEDVNYASSNELDLCHKMGRLVRELHFGEFTHITWLCEEDQLNECNCYNCPLGNLLPIMALLSKNHWWHSPPKYDLCDQLFKDWSCSDVAECDSCPLDNFKPQEDSLLWVIYKEHISETQPITNPIHNGVQKKRI